MHHELQEILALPEAEKLRKIENVRKKDVLTLAAAISILEMLDELKSSAESEYDVQSQIHEIESERYRLAKELEAAHKLIDEQRSKIEDLKSQVRQNGISSS